MAGSVGIVEPGSGEPATPDVARLQAVRLQSRALALRSAEVMARAKATCERVREGRSQREILLHSAFARLHARMGTMAAIEQAKGIVMAQRGCGPEEAFNVLRRLSQHTNVKLHLLAAQIVEQTAASGDGGIVTPISAGARRHRPPGPRARLSSGDPD